MSISTVVEGARTPQRTVSQMVCEAPHAMRVLGAGRTRRQKKKETKRRSSWALKQCNR